jgi:iodotyrosine deiodinase
MSSTFIGRFRPKPLVFTRLAAREARRRSEEFLALIGRRRSVREFSDEPVPRELVENAIRAAATAPSGANRQPWTFVAVFDPAVKAQIREAAEHEEKLLYEGRASEEYLDAIEPIGTDWMKPHLTEAPCVIAIFEQPWSYEADGTKRKNYYVRESVGIAVGFLLVALHSAGLATLTHAPSPMGFLKEILGRPDNERPFLLIPVGYPAEGAVVPTLGKKSLAEVAEFI